LLEAIDILQGVNGLAFVHFDEGDVVRHHLVQRIIRAYDEYKTRQGGQQLPLLETKTASPEPNKSSGGTGAVARVAAPAVSTEEPHVRN
jgi:phosphate starvation-inducible PhoH-like protein